MTNPIYLDRVSNPSPSHSLPQLPTKSLRKAGKIALWSSLFCTCAIALRQQPLLSLPISALVGFNLHSRQQQTQLEKKLSFTNARLETIHNQYSQLETSELQQIEQIQQQLNNFGDRLNAVSQERNTKVTPAKKRVAIFIDGSNLYYALNKLNTRIDYTKLLKLLVGEDTLYRAIYYTGIDSSSNKEHGFVSWLSHNGFRVVTKELVKRADGSQKANLDVEIALDMVELAEQYDKAILVGGDGDFACALDKVSSQGCQVEVVSLRSATSDALIRSSDRYTDLQDIIKSIRKV